MPNKQSSLTRTPLTNKELESLSADEFVRLKLTEDEITRLRAINNARQRERIERSAGLRIEQEPILVELSAAGWNVDSVWNLVNTSTQYAAAIPILLKHLPLPYSDSVREGIARALAVPEPAVQKAWPILVEEYRKAPNGWGVIAIGDPKEYRLGAKDGLACALSVAVTDETLPELIALANDRAHGESRLLLLSALKKRQNSNPLARQAIDKLASDPDLQKEIASWRN